MADPGYTVGGLEHGIVRCNHNITVLKSAIEDEEKQIKEYRRMIAGVKKAEADKKYAEENATNHFEIVEED